MLPYLYGSRNAEHVYCVDRNFRPKIALYGAQS